MNTPARCLLSFFLLFSAFSVSFSQYTVISGGVLINTDGSPPLDDAVIVIEGSRIAAVGLRGEIDIPDDAEIIDAAGRWIIPGLIDSHIHFFQSGGLYTRPDVIDLRNHVPYEEEELQWIKDNLSDTFRRYLRSGITSVVDVGGPMWNFNVREKAETTRYAPTVAVAGPLISTYQPQALTTDDPPIIEVQSGGEARSLVQQQAGHETDLIKIWYIVTRDRTVEDSLPIIEATVDESRAHGLRVSVHATQLETARAAVKAGADILVHSVNDREVDDEFIHLLRENDVIYIPTMMVFERYPAVFNQQISMTKAEFHYAHPDVLSSLFDLRILPEEDIPQAIRQRMQSPQPVPDDRVEMRNLKRLHDAGVIVAAGTDAGNIGTLHGPALFYEFELMERSGLSPMDILITATVNGAKVMGKETDLGTIEAGKRADLVILNSNPLEAIANTADIRYVIKNGIVFTPEELLPETSVDIVKKQVNAYNARDLDAFVSFYHPEAVVYRYPDEVLASGEREIRERYRMRFDGSPHLHAEILNRITLGKYVIDKERITGIEGDDPLYAVVIYEVSDGLIRNSWIMAE